jgi:hypothetical protein
MPGNGGIPGNLGIPIPGGGIGNLGGNAGFILPDLNAAAIN